LGSFAVGEEEAKLLIDSYLGCTNARKAIAPRLRREKIGTGWIYRI
jgi:hypothetical protein